MEFLRVRVKDTGAHISIHAPAFDKAIHVALKSDPLDENGRPRGPKYPSDLTTPDSGGEATPADTNKAEEASE